MHTRYFTLVLVVVVVVLAVIFLFMYGKRVQAPGAVEELSPITATTTQAQKAEIPDIIMVESPVVGAQVQSPFTLAGTARGTWYFEASFPAELRDDEGHVLWQAPVQAQSDWMTQDFVPFQAEVSFNAGTSTHGDLILHKDNPSGLPEHEQELHVPILFAPASSQ